MQNQQKPVQDDLKPAERVKLPGNFEDGSNIVMARKMKPDLPRTIRLLILGEDKPRNFPEGTVQFLPAT